ncbi:MAG: MBL fold metallo-hydrolase [Sphaerochaetaceae bacterium]|nr:MBL fold metallo-hydrolase [Sphaerochaetaceae bacterium]
MKINCLQTGLLQTNCYCITRTDNSDGTVHGAVIDPGDEIRVILSALQAHRCTLDYIILTHAHFDHLLALSDLHEAYPEAKICIGENEPYDVETVVSVAKRGLGPYFRQTKAAQSGFSLPQTDILLKDNSSIFGFKVLWTPGHTRGSICLYDEKEKILFSGDTMFCGSYGRTDLGGNPADMRSSLSRLLSLPSDTLVLSGHGETTTIGEEKAGYGYF